MELIIESKIKECNKDLSKNTIYTYIKNITKIVELMKITDLNIFYNDYETIINVIKTKYNDSDNSQRNKLTSCNAMIKCLITSKNKKKIEKALEEYIKEINILRARINDHLDTHIKSEKETEGWLTKKDIKLITELLLKKVPKVILDIEGLNKLRDYVLFVFYQNLPSRNDIAFSKFYYDDEIEMEDLSKNKELNYIILKKKEKQVLYVMNNYKTSKKYKTQTLELGNKMYKMLVDYKDKMKPFNDDDWFILSNRGNHVSKNTLSEIYSKLGNVIGKKTSIRTNRHIIISQNIDIAKMDDLAKRMGHDIATAIKIYAKRN
jgi:hypothetical protein